MPIVNAKLYRLKFTVAKERVHLFTWSNLIEAITDVQTDKTSNVSRNTLRNICRLPHYKPHRGITKIINTLHDQYFPTPYPPEANAVLSLYRNIAADRMSPYQKQNLELIYRHAELLASEYVENELITCRMHWLLGNIVHDMMKVERDKKGKETVNQLKTKAIEHYTIANSILSKTNNPLEQFKLHQNILACHFNAYPEKSREGSDEINEAILKLDYTGTVTKIIEIEPFNWYVARTGLLISGLIRDRQKVADFYRCLVDFNPQFLDLSYKPHTHDRILNDPDMRWALKEVLTLTYIEHLTSLKERCASEKEK